MCITVLAVSQTTSSSFIAAPVVLLWNPCGSILGRRIFNGSDRRYYRHGIRVCGTVPHSLAVEAAKASIFRSCKQPPTTTATGVDCSGGSSVASEAIAADAVVAFTSGGANIFSCFFVTFFVTLGSIMCACTKFILFTY